MVKIISGILLSLVAMATLGTVALAAPPDDAGMPPDNASCVAWCSHWCPGVPSMHDLAHNLPGPGVSVFAQQTAAEVCPPSHSQP